MLKKLSLKKLKKLSILLVIDNNNLDSNSKNITTYLIEWPKFDLTFISEIDLNITFTVRDSGRIASIKAYTQEGKKLIKDLKV